MSRLPGFRLWLGGAVAGIALGVGLSVSFELARLLLALALVALAFGAPRRADRWLGALTLAATLVAAGPGLWRYVSSPEVRGWNVFHYYLGAQYFPELGYLDLYPAALRADREDRGAFEAVTEVRNQSTYEIESRSEAESAFDPAAHFSADRWRAFRADVAALSQHEGRGTWQQVFVDRGFNATPFWTNLGRGVSSLLPARRPVALKLLAGLDLALLALAGIALWSAFGPELALGAVLLFFLSPVDANRLIGGFLQYDWLAALALGFAAQKRGRHIQAGVAFGYATLVRLFPLLFVAAWLAPSVLRWVRSGRLSRPALRLVSAFAATLVVGFGMGCASSRGVGAWQDFAAKIGFHAESHRFGEQRIGLQHLFTSKWGELSERPSERRAAFEAAQPVAWTVGGLLLLATGAALVRRRGTQAALLGLVPFYVLTVASRYYWSVLSFLPLGVPSCRQGTRALARTLGLAGLVFAGYYGARLAGAGAYGSYLVFEGGLLGLAVAFLVTVLRRDRAVLARWRRARVGVG